MCDSPMCVLSANHEEISIRAKSGMYFNNSFVKEDFTSEAWILVAGASVGTGYWLLVSGTGTGTCAGGTGGAGAGTSEIPLVARTLL
ncbi:hypothetical protein HZH68_006705 [Vespula germanica]|uniref:Uncharacterized protein n=1 Tax=Vespula germanica TaxID=30212 RepID=A0A834KBX4_VESGE|nr:hypothetical protein HZH68_006705 [Vespula germanica]